ncbi:hypothetical protein BDZ89DRAFT_199359 [Hymenopellis radicata]|nr:hypothetical protein BDZ89DRAFT_199359 [Hymenopellis radicata]
MVTTNDQSKERKDATSKLTSLSKKKAPGAAVWPCKISGCNKQFAREADLKRHQRTTKLHSMPGYQCPQCDATFTRTDALRRHQKSRHNGVIIDPVEPEPIAGPSSPSLKGKEPMPMAIPTTQPGPKHLGSSTPATGHSSYYRQHTAMTTGYIPQYAHIALPTSATRLNTATNWSQSSPWTAASYSYLPPIDVTVYQPAPSPYYRQHNTEAVSPSPPTPESPRQSGSPQNDSNSSQSGPQTPEAASDAGAPYMTVTEEQIKQFSMHLADGTLAEMLKAKYHTDDSRGVSLEEINNSHSPYEHVLTEDGETMLNPAELLTQESLASPPPS